MLEHADPFLPGEIGDGEGRDFGCDQLVMDGDGALDDAAEGLLPALVEGLDLAPVARIARDQLGHALGIDVAGIELEVPVRACRYCPGTTALPLRSRRACGTGSIGFQSTKTPPRSKTGTRGSDMAGVSCGWGYCPSAYDTRSCGQTMLMASPKRGMKKNCL